MTWKTNTKKNEINIIQNSDILLINIFTCIDCNISIFTPVFHNSFLKLSTLVSNILFDAWCVLLGIKTTFPRCFILGKSSLQIEVFFNQNPFRCYLVIWKESDILFCIHCSKKLSSMYGTILIKQSIPCILWKL